MKQPLSRSLWLGLLASASLLGGCASSVRLDQPEAASVEVRPLDGSQAAASGNLSTEDALAQPAGTPSARGTTLAGQSGQAPVAVVNVGAGGVTQVTAGGGQASGPSAAAALAATGAGNVVYFDFDSYVVHDEFRPLIERHAKALQAAAKRKLLIEGHTDERGGREYNLALGQKRAEAVEKALALLGVAPARLEAVSWGEERPADAGHNEAAWSRNRRAELKER